MKKFPPPYQKRASQAFGTPPGYKRKGNDIHGHKAPERVFCTMLYSQHITQATGEDIPGFALKEGTFPGFASKCMQLNRNPFWRYPQHKL
jgi:hypothetical protein